MASPKGCHLSLMLPTSKWFRTTDAWSDRQARAEAALDGVTTEASDYEWQSDGLWKDIQKYGALADVVLPKLFEEVNETRDGYTDLQPSDIDPEEVVGRLEELRTEREEELGKPVKLVLLLDEVSLFIGTDFERLTELQTLAENVDDIGDGDIQLVATAQAKIEDVQPKFAAHGADFSIVRIASRTVTSFRVSTSEISPSGDSSRNLKRGCSRSRGT